MEKVEKAPFIKRLCSYIIDYLIVVVVVSLISTPFIDTKKVEKLENEANKIVEKYQNGDISSDEYVKTYTSNYYSLSRSTGLMTFITIIVDIIYFAVIQLYNKGQTLGKMIMRIQVESTDGDLGMNQMIFRSLVANMILVNIINFSLLTFASKDIFSGVSITLSFVQYIVMFISIILATKKDGRTIHDRIAHTRVVCVK